MTKKEADFISDLRSGSRVYSWSRISELYCEAFKKDLDKKGSQLHGADLCVQAMMVLSGVTSAEKIPDKVREKWAT